MKAINDVVQYVLNLGPSVMLPIMILIIALIFRVPFSKALRSGLTIGIGFVGINLVIGVLSDNLGPAAQAMVKRFGFHLTVIDTGWPSAASAAWAAPVSAVLIPICLFVNVALLLSKVTKTLDIDLWNYWHFIAAGATGYIVTNGNWIFSIICAVIYEIACLIIADKTAPLVAKFYGLEGVSLPTGSTDAFGLVGIPIGILISKIPGLNKLHADPESIQKRFGIFGEPMMMGIIIGAAIAALGGYDIGGIMKMGINMGAVMFLMPRMVKILMEGLIPISESARDFLQKRWGDREIYLGMDAAITTGHPANLATGLLLVPITLFLAVVLPGNKVLPFGDLATIPFYVSLIVAHRKANIVQSVITGTVVIAFALWMATNFAPVHTEMMRGVYKFPKGATMVSTLDMGGNFLNWVILKFSQLFAGVL
ncbi:PTS galactitol transporter subunit IIC [Enterococcus sp. CSURQ0835]|uniref:PTS galactitol transporter subunit IIC n=1 Tax=Enterococcus sp. CSURQ0835 TaxID=2681394 RepID=UPI00135BC3CA|nr:PTS transporter subunit IIC [Enterococcus sp. CSURQ0835]